MADSVPATPVRPPMVTLPRELGIINADNIARELADNIGRQLAVTLPPGTPVVIADMTATAFCDTSGVRMLVLACRRATANGAELRLLAPRPQVLRLLQLLGADTVLPVYHSLPAALAGGPHG